MAAIEHEQPWLEKYRPKVMEDIVGNEDTVGRLQVLAQQGNMPNLILSGPPGTGKTTSVLALARTLLGDAFKEGVLELNASDDRGIDVVRGRIKAFAQKKVRLRRPDQRAVCTRACPRYLAGAAGPRFPRSVRRAGHTPRWEAQGHHPR